MPENENINKGEIIIYQTDDGDTRINVRFEDETVWLTQAQMADLYQSSRTNIVEHIQHIYEERELDEAATCRKFRQVRKEGNRQVLDLYATSVDYDPKSAESIAFLR